MKSAITVLKEQLKYFYLIRRLSIYEIKSKNYNNYLGMTWEIINPTIQLLIYWFVFGTIRTRAPIEMNGFEVPFFPWLMAGFFLWTFSYQSLIQGSQSIYKRLRMLSKMNFPMSVIPNFVIFSNFYIHLVMLFITIVIFHFIVFYICIFLFVVFNFIGHFNIINNFQGFSYVFKFYIKDVVVCVGSTMAFYIFRRTPFIS